MAPPPELRALDRRRSRAPGPELDLVGAARDPCTRSSTRARPNVVAELEKQVSRDPLEGRDVLAGHLLTPAPDACRRRTEKPLLVRLCRDVDSAGVVEHR